MSNIAIEFQSVGKMYRLGRVGTGTLSHDLLHKMAVEQLTLLDKCNAKHKFRKLLPGNDTPQLPE